MFYINVPIVDMKELPSEQSKVVSQAIFAEQIEVDGSKVDWRLITTSDGYQGWIPVQAFIVREEEYGHDGVLVSRLAAHVYAVKDIEFGPYMTLPYSCKVNIVDASDTRWLKISLPDERECYLQKGDVASIDKIENKADLIPFAKRFLGLPYTWGGRSSFGYDCSGFAQMLYGQLGIQLPRDSYMQVDDERFRSIEFDELEPGDLLFWGKSEARIMHVGMYISDNQFIHATARENMPYLRISSLDDPEWAASEDVYYPYRTARQLR